MTTTHGTDQEPLWLAIERQISDLDSQALSAGGLEGTVRTVAGDLDEAGYAVSTNAGYMIELRRALEAQAKVGHPMMEDLNKAFDSLTLEDVEDTYAGTLKMARELGETWPRLKEFERRSHIQKIIEGIKLDLQVKKAKGFSQDGGIRYLIEEEIEPPVIIERMEIDQAKFDEVLAAVEAERAERARVRGLLEGVAEKSVEEQVRHLINKDVEEDLIVEMAGVEPSVVVGVKEAMEEEIREQQRLKEEAAAKKAAEAAGPPIEEIEPDEMLEHIEAIREIMEFSDQEDEIRTMCEQSMVPMALVDIAVSDPDKLDELEEKAEAEA